MKGDDSAVARVYHTGRAARADYTAARGGPLAEAARLGGTRFPVAVPGEPVRTDELTASRGLYAVARQAGLTDAVSVPIVVDGTVWGAVNIGSTKNERFLPDAEERLARLLSSLQRRSPTPP